uniref:Uncharacterized protein n=1 Tax=Arundo donax TaxID=35708 RepID=A0A0A9GVN6_ARUDO
MRFWSSRDRSKQVGAFLQFLIQEKVEYDYLFHQLPHSGKENLILGRQELGCSITGSRVSAYDLSIISSDLFQRN